jgi:catechol 2,3-dioxygenase-like lactoylglutathione lyase family enzyme
MSVSAFASNAHDRTTGTTCQSHCDEECSVTFDRVHHVQLAMPSGQEHAARDFYVGVLEMVEIDKPPALAQRGGAWFRAGGVELHLGVEDDFRPARKAHPGLLTPDLDEVARRLTRAGHAVEGDANFPGYRRCYVSDPFGNRLEFLQRQP